MGLSGPDPPIRPYPCVPCVYVVCMFVYVRQAPWMEVQAMMTRQGNDAVGRFIANKARKLTSSYYAFAP